MNLRDFKFIDGLPAVRTLVAATIESWPSHSQFIKKSLSAQSACDFPALEELAARIIKLAGENLSSFVESYRWLCDVFNEEQLFFIRNGHYRCSSFAEALDSVYSNREFMRKYMEGLLLSQLFWSNHAKSFLSHRGFVASLPSSYRYLEVGPGHGLYLATVGSDPRCAEAVGWDVSEESLAQTARSLTMLGVERPVRLLLSDVQAANADEQGFDAIVISEVLEHLDEPAKALTTVAACLSEGGRVFINFPVNSPAPDHIYLLRSLEEVVALTEACGPEVENCEAHPATGYTVERARTALATISCIVIAGKRKR